MPQILAPTDESIAKAAQWLRSGGVVAFSTETVYGLGADTFNKDGLRRIYELKGRPVNNPLIAHVLDWNQAKALLSPSFVREANQTDSLVSKLVGRFWPGPLTLVMPKSPHVPDLATAGLPTIAVRSPAHPVARRILEAFGSAISAPSANLSGFVSATSAQHVAADFAGAADLMILDGGPSDVGIESTVLDLTASPPRVLRPGAVTLEQLREFIPAIQAPAIMTQSTSPGTAASHYAPRTPVEIAAGDIEAYLRKVQEPVAALLITPMRISPPHKSIQMPAQPKDYAHVLYDSLRQADELGCTRIIIEQPPATEHWLAIRDRLSRAAAPRK